MVKNKQTNVTTTTKYILESDKVVYESDDAASPTQIHYTYGSNGKLLSLNYNGTEYYYIFNAQDDVIGLLDTNGNQVVTYQYDAWGEPGSHYRYAS